MRAQLFFFLFLVCRCSDASDVCSEVYHLEDMGWYKQQMRAAEASPLCATDSPEIELYRFVWLSSFHNSIVVTAERHGVAITLRAVRLNGAGGYAPGRVIQRKTRSLTFEEFRKFS